VQDICSIFLSIWNDSLLVSFQTSLFGEDPLIALKTTCD